MLSRIGVIIEEYEAGAHLFYIASFTAHQSGLAHWVHTLPGYWQAVAIGAGTAVWLAATIATRKRRVRQPQEEQS